jgi:hypothetical protein
MAYRTVHSALRGALTIPLPSSGITRGSHPELSCYPACGASTWLGNQRWSSWRTQGVCHMSGAVSGHAGSGPDSQFGHVLHLAAVGATDVL